MNRDTESPRPEGPKFAEPKPSSQVPKADGPRRRRLGLVVLVILVGSVAALPSIVANTSLRDVVINEVLDNPQLEASSTGASFGWMTPLQIDRLSLTRTDNNLRIDISQVRLRKAWPQVLVGLPTIGHVVIDQPTVEVTVADELFEQPDQSREQPRILLSAAVNDAAVRILVPGESKPAIALNGVDLDVEIVHTDSGRVLRLDPVTILDHTELSPALCEQGIKRIAPILADTANVAGSVSLELAEFELPLDGASPEERSGRTNIQGTLRLHKVTTGLKSPMLRQMTGIFAKLFKFPMPDVVHVADDTTVRFSMRNRKVYHEGLAFILPQVSPEFVWRTSGSVGLDDTLDLEVEAQLPLTLLGDGRMLRQLADQRLVLHIRGTLDKPIVEFPDNQNWFEQAAQIVLSEAGVEPTPDGIANAAINLIRSAAENRESNGTPLFERLRARREQRRNEVESETATGIPGRRRGLFRRRD